MEVLKPNETERTQELKIGDRCPTCNQRIEKPITRDDIWRVIRVFKMVCGVDKDDRAWDKMFYPRYMGKAKQLIEFLGSWENACDCVEHIGGKLKDLGRTFTFETIVTHSTSWKIENLK